MTPKPKCITLATFTVASVAALVVFRIGVPEPVAPAASEAYFIASSQSVAPTISVITWRRQIWPAELLAKGDLFLGKRPSSAGRPAACASPNSIQTWANP